ncbi:MAG: hypothetical protein ACR2ID_00685 [Chthoniobacterales bacterium]
MPGSSAHATSARLFDWSPPEGRKLSLASFIAASAMLHVLCFYLFQVIYPPTIALPQPPAHVNIINPETDEGRVLLRWLEAEDPALASTTQRSPNAAALALPHVEHIPSYANYRPALKEPPPYQPDLRVPSAEPPGPVHTARASTPAPAPRSGSSVSFADAELGPAITPELKFRGTTKQAPQAAEFRVAIDAAGAVRYCFLDHSSGDPALDAQARQSLMRCRFPDVAQHPPPPPPGLLWSRATIEWGNDLVPGPTPAAEAPQP